MVMLAVYCGAGLNLTFFMLAASERADELVYTAGAVTWGAIGTVGYFLIGNQITAIRDRQSSPCSDGPDEYQSMAHQLQASPDDEYAYSTAEGKL